MKREDMSIDEYASYLELGGDTGESPIPGEFIRDDDKVWFVSGGSQCVGSAFCNWHNGMDAVYAVGSSTIANVGIDCETLEEALNILERIDVFDSPYDKVERDWLVELGRAAIAAKPSESVQYVYE